MKSIILICLHVLAGMLAIHNTLDNSVSMSSNVICTYAVQLLSTTADQLYIV